MSRDGTTSTYEKQWQHQENNKRKKIVKKSFDDIIDKKDVNAESNCFITIKDYKGNLLIHPKVLLINPAKTKLGRISKTILDNINK